MFQSSPVTEDRCNPKRAAPRSNTSKFQSSPVTEDRCNDAVEVAVGVDEPVSILTGH